MPRSKATKATEPAHRAEGSDLEAEAAEADAKPEQNEGNESAMAGREATAEDRKGPEE